MLDMQCGEFNPETVFLNIKKRRNKCVPHVYAFRVMSHNHKSRETSICSEREKEM